MAGGVERRMIDGWSIRHDPDLEALARSGSWWPDTTIAEAMARQAAEVPERELLVDATVRVTAAALYRDATRLADALRRRGIARGDVVSFMLPNWHEAATVYLASAMLGAVSHPLVTNFRHAELAFMLADCRSKMIFVPAYFRGCDYRDLLAEVCAGLDAPPQVVVLRGEAGKHIGYDELIASGNAGATFEPVDPRAVRMILYTSGTTGRPKGVLHTHNSINADIVQLHRHWNRERRTRWLVPSPVSHIGGSLYAFEMPMLFGTSAVLMEQWDGATGAALIDAEHCTHMAGATPFLEQLLTAARAGGSQLPSLELFICGGASVPPSLIRDANAYFATATASRVYGSTEVPTITIGSVSPDDGEHAAETDGRIGAAIVRVAGNDGEGNGELLAKAPQMLVGYLNPADEQTAFDADGFFRMGDLGRVIDGEYIVITGRQKDIIIRNGENISPKEVEDLLIADPRIAAIAIVGLPHPRTGELACACIVPAAGAAPTIPDLTSILAQHGVARFKYPERIVLLPDLPRNASGKVLKHMLRADLISRDAVA